MPYMPNQQKCNQPCQEGQSEMTFPVFAFSSWFFSLFLDFSLISPYLFQISPVFFFWSVSPPFLDFWQNFHYQYNPCPPWLHHCPITAIRHCYGGSYGSLIDKHRHSHSGKTELREISLCEEISFLEWAYSRKLKCLKVDFTYLYFSKWWWFFSSYFTTKSAMI